MILDSLLQDEVNRLNPSFPLFLETIRQIIVKGLFISSSSYSISTLKSSSSSTDSTHMAESNWIRNTPVWVWACVILFFFLFSYLIFVILRDNNCYNRRTRIVKPKRVCQCNTSTSKSCSCTSLSSSSSFSSSSSSSSSSAICSPSSFCIFQPSYIGIPPASDFNKPDVEVDLACIIGPTAAGPSSSLAFVSSEELIRMEETVKRIQHNAANKAFELKVKKAIHSLLKSCRGFVHEPSLHHCTKS